MTKYFQKPFFRKLFLSYTAILLACSLVFSSILFQQILQQEHSVQEQQCRSDAQLLMQVVDDKFTEIENIGTQLASASGFKRCGLSQKSSMPPSLCWNAGTSAKSCRRITAFCRWQTALPCCSPRRSRRWTGSPFGKKSGIFPPLAWRT